MFKSYFKIGWRNLVKEKGYSFINIGGLALGMAVAMLIGLWVYDELTYNKYHENYDNIGRVVRKGTLNGETGAYTQLPYALDEELKLKHGNNFKHVVVAWPIGDHILSVKDVKLSVSGGFIGASAPEMFSFKMIEGARSGLSDPNSILLSQSTAQTLFGNESPIDKLLRIDNNMDVKVTGVYEDLPHNSHFHGAKFFAPWDLLVLYNGWIKYQGFGNNFLGYYVEINEHTSFNAASENIKDAILNNIKDDKEYVAVNPQLFLHPMKDWHLKSSEINGFNSAGRLQIVWLFGAVGCFVLLLACINFMNLSTARSEKRAKEVGIRKAIGSARIQLIGQFFSESFLVVILAFVLANVFVSVTLAWFNELAGKQLLMPWTSLYFWTTSFGFIIITGLLAGSYPALYLSSFNSIKALKGSLRLSRFASAPRKILVVVQFSVSVALIIGTVIVYQQIQFAKNRNAGYSRDGLMVIPINSGDFHGKFDVLRTELKNTGVVAEIAKSSSPPTDIWNSNGGFDWRGKDPNFQAEFSTFTVTPQYGKVVDWQVVSGRDLRDDLASDSMAFVINESAAKVFGFENPVGETVQWKTWWTNGVRNFTIVGVVKDMVVKSPYTPSAPSVYFLGGSSNWVNLRIETQTDAATALAKIETVIKKIVPSVPFDYKFADQEYALKFAAEERIGKLTSVFAALAIFISCLGLSGLASFVAEQRTKEIGIRKVVGASVFNLWKMLSKDFLVLVLIACAVTIPVAYYFMNDWLSAYQYRTEISWWVLGATCIGALVITVATVSYQAIRAAMMNPVKSLKSE